MAEPVVMFGIGATKAGTSWLHRYLSAHPECYLRSIKELHFFDTVEGMSRNWVLKEFDEKSRQLEQRILAGRAPADGRAEARLTEIRLYARILRKEDEEAYLAFLTEGVAEERLVGDITPAYSLLPAEWLARMAALSPRTRFVYIMRDPVDRLWSHVRMIARRRARKLDEVPRRAERILERALAGGEAHITERGDYRAVLEKLAQAVAAERVHLCTYEELFSDAGIGALCRFLGITPIRGDYGRRVHEGIRLPLAEETRRRMAEFLRPQYDYVAQRLGQVPPAWAANYAGA